jgi:16S rRNA (guanine966-N2)-methyltransferase
MRVIAGRFRGRKLSAPRGERTRPTSDRVREALFSVLGDVAAARVADLYAGTGALGIEALSRGASHVTFVEPAGPALACIRQNLASLGLEASASVLALGLERAGKALAANGPYDLVFCDPPWADLPRATRTLARVMKPSLFAATATLTIEHPEELELEPLDPTHELVDRRSWGGTGVSIFRVRGKKKEPCR